MTEAESEALANSDGLLACSPEIWEMMNTCYVVIYNKYTLPYSWKSVIACMSWTEQEAEDAAATLDGQGECGVTVLKYVFDQQRAKKFSELIDEELRIFPASEEDDGIE